MKIDGNQKYHMEGVAKDITNIIECSREYLPDSREKSLVITNLEQAGLWLKKLDDEAEVEE